MHIRLNIYMRKSKLSSYKEYLFDLLFSTNAKKAHADQSIPRTFLLCLKRNVLQSFKKSSCKKVLIRCVCIDPICFEECFLFHVISGKHYFLYKFIVTQRLCAIAMLLFWKKSVFYIHHLHNNITMLLIRKVQNKTSTS